MNNMPLMIYNKENFGMNNKCKREVIGVIHPCGIISETGKHSITIVGQN